MTLNGRIEGGRQWLLVVSVALLAVIPRLFYLRVPFERDEGAYAYVADCIGRGGLPYRDAFDHKPPVIYYLYRLSFDLFGHSVTAPRLMAALFVAAACLLTTLLVFRLTRHLAAALVAAIVLGIASSSPAYTGFTANTELFILPFLVGGVLLLADEAPSSRRFFWSGLLFGIGIMVKQPVAMVAVAAAGFRLFCLLRTPRSLLQRGVLFSVGLLLPVTILALYFTAQGAGRDFWDGAFGYNLGYLAGPSLAERLAHAQKTLLEIRQRDPYTWLAGGVGLLLAFFRPSGRSQWYYLALVTVGAAVAAGMGGDFYPHYFIFLLPLMAVFMGLGLAVPYGRRLPRLLLSGGLLLMCSGVLLNLRYVTMPTKKLLEICYAYAPFARSLPVADYLKRVLPPGQTFYIVGSEPQLYFYTGVTAPSRIFYFYPLVTPTAMTGRVRQELLTDLQRRPPQYFVFVNHPGSHNLEGQADPFVRDLFRQFASYRLVAISNTDIEGIIDDEQYIRQWQGVPGLGAILVFRQPATASQDTRPTFGSLMGV